MGISHLCFGLSYLTAFGLEAYRTIHHTRWSRVAGVIFAIAGLLADGDLAARLRLAGPRQAAKFRWATTARQTWAILAAVLSLGAWWSWALLAVALGLRCAVALQVGGGVVHDRAVSRYLWLLPLRDLIAFGVWFWSFADNKVRWRGDIFVLEDGKIRPADLGDPKLISAEPEHDKVSAHW